MKPRRGEPRFDIDFKYGRQGELQIGELLDWIAAGNGRVEVKRKRILDLHFYVETHCDKGRTGAFASSGISVTTAHAWAFCIDDTGVAIIVPTDRLREMLDDPSTRDKCERDGSCPTRGKLVSLAVLLLREKQRRGITSPSTPPAVAADPLTTCKHKPEFVEDGRCRICEAMRRTA